MDFAGPTSIGILLIAIGIALFSASFRIASVARRYRTRMENLLQLASMPLDPLDLPAAAWPDLATGGWQSLHWEGIWFGQPVTGTIETTSRRRRAKASAPLHVRLVSGEEAVLRLTLVHCEAWGENRLFADHLARVFVLLLETRLHARTEALSAALAERARLSLYLQHDMRNLAQWVLWVCADFAAESAETMHAAARRLRANAPLARERSERLIASLGNRPEVEQATLTDLRDAAMKAARLAGVEPDISGEGSAWVAPGLLARALDNLFVNIATAWREGATSGPVLHLRTATGPEAMTELDFFSPWPPQTAPLAAEKLFEPFASGRPGGLGLGLYQARKSLREAGGDLQATPAPEGLTFLLRLPARHP